MREGLELNGCSRGVANGDGDGGASEGSKPDSLATAGAVVWGVKDMNGSASGDCWDGCGNEMLNVVKVSSSGTEVRIYKPIISTQ